MGLSNLTVLFLHDIDITGDGLVHLARLNRLRRLFLGGTGTVRLVHLKTIVNLSELHLNRTEITNKELARTAQPITDPTDLALTRLEQIMAGQPVLITADMTNRRTNEANYNSVDIKTMLADFRAKRDTLVARFEELDETDWVKSALHPLLQQPMRIVDIDYFNSEHDYYPLARISQLIRAKT